MIILVFLLVFVSIAAMAAETQPLQLSRLGSRFTVIPEPHTGHFRILPLGHGFFEDSGLFLTVETSHGTLRFPPETTPADIKYQPELTPTSVAFTLNVPGHDASVQYRILSPLTPCLENWRTAPVMLIQLTLINRESNPVTCRLSLHGMLNHSHTASMTGNLASVTAPLEITIDQASLVNREVMNHISPHLAALEWESPSNFDYSSTVTGSFLLGASPDEGWVSELIGDLGRVTVSLTAPANDSARVNASALFHTTSPVLSVDGLQCSFAYAATFPDPTLLLSETTLNLKLLAEHDHAACALIKTDSLSPALNHLTHIALQSFLGCTWLVRNPDGSTRYSEWEGFPLYHCTMDVVFNTSLFHLVYTPDFLADMLRHWPLYRRDLDMPHDMGKGLVILHNDYPVQMITEENANFLLLHAMYAARTNDFSIAKEQKQILTQVIHRLLESDSDGNGLPDTGCINTFDDAPPSINTSENQMYLGIKKAAALQASVAVLNKCLPEDTVRAARTRSDLIYNTIIQSWTGTHFPIALPSSGNQPATGKITTVLIPVGKNHTAPPAAEATDNLDGFSNYAAHGLVALWICGQNAPNQLESMMKEHLAIAHLKTSTPYGDSHRDGHANVWVSQNMWRDLAARYLGADLDFDALHQRYLRVQCEAVPRRDGYGHWEGFCDSPFNSFLTAYSRGIPVLAFAWFNITSVDLPEYTQP